MSSIYPHLLGHIFVKLSINTNFLLASDFFVGFALTTITNHTPTYLSTTKWTPNPCALPQRFLKQGRGSGPMNGMGPMGVGAPMMGGPMARGPMARGPMVGPRGYGMGPPPGAGGFGMGGPGMGGPRGPPGGFGMGGPPAGMGAPRGPPNANGSGNGHGPVKASDGVRS